jgi:hypothetical protein
MKKYLPLLAAFLLCQSCKKSNEDPIVKTPEIISTEHEILVSGPNLLSNHTGIQGDVNYNLLGYGYDVTGKYADTSAVRNSVIDIATFAVDNPQRIMSFQAVQSSFDVISANNAVELSHQLSSSLEATNGFNFFKATITSAFPDQDALSKKYVYTYYSIIARQKMIKTFEGADRLGHYLTPAFKQDIQVLSAADLVKKYGTHILSGIYTGNRFNILYQGEIKNDNNRTKAAQTGFIFTLTKVFHLFSGSLDPINLSNLENLKSSKVFCEVRGGDPKRIKIDITTKIPTIDIQDWASNFTEKQTMFVEIDQKNGLIPLYDFISDPSKQADVKDYITSYLSNNQVKLTN